MMIKVQGKPERNLRNKGIERIKKKMKKSFIKNL